MILLGWLWLVFGWIAPGEMRAVKLHGLAQGTTYSITYYAADSIVTTGSVDSVIAVIDRSMSLYKLGSYINQFNASKTGICVDEHFARVVQKALYVFRQSEGEFDITVGPLVRAWGFGPQTAGAMPDSVMIRKIRAYTGSGKLRIHGLCLKKEHPQLQLDVNGIAQGYTVDRLADLLQSRGIKNFMVELGGEIRVQGVKKPSGEPFKIGVESPSARDPEAIMQRSVSVTNAGITTSGNYRKFYTSGGRKVSHLISPKTGYPLQNGMISATVIAKDAFTADAFDNVFMAFGVTKTFKYLEAHRDMEALLIYQRPDGTVADTATTGFYTFNKKK